MFRTIILFGLILFLLELLSCKKEQEIKTNAIYEPIKPLVYFPAFPGSYWIYDNGDTLRVASQYQMFVFGLANGDPLNYDTLFLPKLEPSSIYTSNGSNGFVNEYKLTAPSIVSYIQGPIFRTFLSTKEGSVFINGPYFQGHSPMAKTIKVDTSIFIGQTKYEDVLITIHWDEACIINGYGNSPEECASLKEYYGKNIGLLKREHRYSSDTLFIKDFELVKYHIEL